MRVKSSLVGGSKEIRAYLELLLLTLVANITVSSTIYFPEAPRCPPDEILHSVKAWISEFDFLTLIHSFPHADGKIREAVCELIKVSH